MFHLSVKTATRSLLGRKDKRDYVDVGIIMGTKELYKAIGLTDTPMLYNYEKGLTYKIEPERAMLFLEKFDILIDLWPTVDALRAECTNRRRGKELAYEPIKKIMAEIVKVSQIESCEDRQRGLLGLIAKYY